MPNEKDYYVYQEPNLVKRKLNLERELEIINDQERRDRAYEEWLRNHKQQHPASSSSYEPKTEAERERYEREKHQQKLLQEIGKETNAEVKKHLWKELKELDIEIDRRGISRREFEKELEEERKKYLYLER